MSSFVISNHWPLVRSPWYIRFFEKAETIVADRNKVNEALYSERYMITITENNWVIGVHTYVNGLSICDFLGCRLDEIVSIKNEINKTGVCRITKRKSLFKKLSFIITGIWDY